MIRLRSILPLILALVTTFLVSCGGNVVQPPASYTADTISQLERPTEAIVESRNELESRVGNLIAQQNWLDIESFIHGPLGELRHDMSFVARNLLPQDKTKAKALADDIFGHFERMDAAIKDKQYSLVSKNYQEVLTDLDAFIDLIPTAIDIS